MTSCELLWLKYARAVITSPRAHCICPAQSRRIRWPGYIGADYDRGRVLMFGAIHNTGRLFTEEITALEPLARAWAHSPASRTHDRAYLKTMRAAYLHSIPQWQSWMQEGRTHRGAVWSNLKTIIKSLGIGWEHIAFTNLAKCHTPTQSDDTQTILSCLRSFSIVDLVADLDPLAVFIAKDERSVNPAAFVPSSPGRLVRRYNNRNGRSGDLRIAEWLQADAAQYRRLANFRS